MHRHAMRFTSTVRPLSQLSCTTGAFRDSDAVILAVQAVHKVGGHLVRLGTVVALLRYALDLVVSDDATCGSLLLLLPVLTDLSEQVGINDVFVLALADDLVVLVGLAAWQH